MKDGEPCRREIFKQSLGEQRSQAGLSQVLGVQAIGRPVESHRAARTAEKGTRYLPALAPPVSDPVSGQSGKSREARQNQAHGKGIKVRAQRPAHRRTKEHRVVRARDNPVVDSFRKQIWLALAEIRVRRLCWGR